MKGKELIDFLRPYKRYSIYVNGHELETIDIAIRKERVDIEKHCGVETPVITGVDWAIPTEPVIKRGGPFSKNPWKRWLGLR
jgi:hypothetical protein